MADKEIRLDIGDRYGNNMHSYYPEDDIIVSLSTDRELFSGAPSVGNCICGELNAELVLDSVLVPHNGKIIPYIRDVGENNWHKRSEFFVFNRDTDEKLGTLKIKAYDAIYRAEQPMMQEGVQGTWPMLDVDAMQNIASRTGAPLSSATIALFNAWYSAGKSFKVQYPGIILESGIMSPETGDAARTMREVAASIAVAYAGNWMINNNGEWQLVQFGHIPKETFYLITETGDYLTIGYSITSDNSPKADKTYYTKVGNTYVKFTGSSFAPGTTYYEGNRILIR